LSTFEIFPPHQEISTNRVSVNSWVVSTLTRFSKDTFQF